MWQLIEPWARLVFGVACAGASAAIAWRAWLDYRWARAGPLRWFALSFALLGAAHLSAVVSDLVTRNTASLAIRRFDGLDVLFWLYYLCWIGALGSLLATFDRRKLRLVLALGPFLLVAGPVLQVVVIVLLALVGIHAGLNHIERHNAGSRVATTGYFLVLLGAFFDLWDYDPLTPRSVAGLAATLGGLVLVWVAMRARVAEREDAA